MQTLEKLNNGCYVLARNENIVLAYNTEALDFVTWQIDDDDTQQTIDGGYYSNVEDGVDCYFKRAGIDASPSHKLKLIGFINDKIETWWERVLAAEDAELKRAWHRSGES